jgi:hypothetical protein
MLQPSNANDQLQGHNFMIAHAHFNGGQHPEVIPGHVPQVRDVEFLRRRRRGRGVSHGKTKKAKKDDGLRQNQTHM